MRLHFGHNDRFLGTIEDTVAGLDIQAATEVDRAQIVGVLSTIYTGEPLPQFMATLSNLSGQAGYWARVPANGTIIEIPDTIDPATLPQH